MAPVWNGREYPACANCGHSEIIPMHTGGVPGVICECGCDSYVPV